MTLPEVLLWRELRARPGGLKFRRQHPAGPYVLDFYCEAAKLAVEVDGEAHERGDMPGRDKERDEWLRVAGIRTLRVPAREVLQNVEAVVLAIVDSCRAKPLHHPPAAGGPPPLQGGS
jgi:very-short-patch-repair endonuclease